MIPSAIQKATVATPVRTIHCRREREIDVSSLIGFDQGRTVWREHSKRQGGTRRRASSPAPPVRRRARSRLLGPHPSRSGTRTCGSQFALPPAPSPTTLAPRWRRLPERQLARRRRARLLLRAREKQTEEFLCTRRYATRLTRSRRGRKRSKTSSRTTCRGRSPRSAWRRRRWNTVRSPISTWPTSPSGWPAPRRSGTSTSRRWRRGSSQPKARSGCRSPAVRTCTSALPWLRPPSPGNSPASIHGRSGSSDSPTRSPIDWVANRGHDGMTLLPPPRLPGMDSDCRPWRRRSRPAGPNSRC